MSVTRTPEGDAAVDARSQPPTSAAGSTADPSPLPPLLPVASPRAKRRSSPTFVEQEEKRALFTAKDKVLVPMTRADGSPGPVVVKDRVAPLTTDGKRWKTVQAAIALSLEHERSEVAKMLGITERTLTQYMYEARKAGLLGSLADPKDEVEFGIIPKAVRNLDALLDHTNDDIKERATMKVLDSTLWKPTVAGPVGPVMGLQVNIVQPEGTAVAIREGTIKSTANFLDAEVDGE